MNATELSSRFTARNQSEALRAMEGRCVGAAGSGAMDVRTSKGWSGHGEPKDNSPRA